MPKPACVACKRFYRPLKNGVIVNEQMPTVNGALPGLTHPALWKPYKIWEADLWQCEGCGHQLISGWGHEPVVKHQPQFATKLTYVTHSINDC